MKTMKAIKKMERDHARIRALLDLVKAVNSWRADVLSVGIRPVKEREKALAEANDRLNAAFKDVEEMK